MEPSIKYARKIFRKTNISNPLIHTHTYAYQGIRNVSFSENFVYVLNVWPLLLLVKIAFQNTIIQFENIITGIHFNNKKDNQKLKHGGK